MRVLCLWWLVVSDWCNMSLLSYDARAVRPLRGRGTVAHQRNGGWVIGVSRYLKLGNLFRTNAVKIIRPAASDPSTSLTAGPPPLSGEDWHACCPPPLGGGGPLHSKRNGGGVIGDSRYLKLGNSFHLFFFIFYAIINIFCIYNQQ